LVRACGDHLCGPAVSYDLRTAEIWIADRQRNERDPRPQTAQCRHHEVHRIADQQGNPIAGLDAFLKQASGHSPSCGAQLVPGQRAIQILDSGPIRGSIGVVQHRTEHPVVRHAFSQVLHARYSRSPVELFPTAEAMAAADSAGGAAVAGPNTS
jgi:hypothetical protein